MGLFGSNNPFTEPLAKLTSELNTETDWGAVLELCDKIKASPKGSQDFCYIIFNKLNHKVPHVSMQALTVLDACVSNCGKEFHKEMASQNFTESIREVLYSYKNPTVVTRMKYLVRKWAEEFKNDPDLSHFVSIYYYLRGEGMVFPEEDESDPQSRKKTVAPVPVNADAVSSQQEADDIAKAIEASLKEEQEKNKRKSPSLYPSVVGTSVTSSPSYTSSQTYAMSSNNRERRKVKALYDFEAAEDNELTFHTGDIITILDDSDVNWWKGEGSNGVGLFPANFVTSDLKAEPEVENSTAKVSFNEHAEVKEIVASEPVLTVNEELIDSTLLLLQNTDPETSTEDSPELLRNEETCRQMEQLIDSRLEKIDSQHLELTMLNEKILESLKMYDHLMKEIPAYGNPQMMKSGSGMSMGGIPKTPYGMGYSQQGTMPPPQQYATMPMEVPGTMPGMGNTMPMQYNTMYQHQQPPQMVPPQQQVPQPHIQQQPDPQQQGFVPNQQQYVMDPNQAAQLPPQSFQMRQYYQYYPNQPMQHLSQENLQNLQRQDSLSRGAPQAVPQGAPQAVPQGIPQAPTPNPLTRQSSDNVSKLSTSAEVESQ